MNSNADMFLKGFVGGWTSSIDNEAIPVSDAATGVATTQKEAEGKGNYITGQSGTRYYQPTNTRFSQLNSLLAHTANNYLSNGFDFGKAQNDASATLQKQNNVAWRASQAASMEDQGWDPVGINAWITSGDNKDLVTGAGQVLVTDPTSGKKVRVSEETAMAMRKNAKPDVYGSAESGYFTLDENNKPVPLVEGVGQKKTPPKVVYTDGTYNYFDDGQKLPVGTTVTTGGTNTTTGGATPNSTDLGLPSDDKFKDGANNGGTTPPSSAPEIPADGKEFNRDGETLRIKDGVVEVKKLHGKVLGWEAAGPELSKAILAKAGASSNPVAFGGVMDAVRPVLNADDKTLGQFTGAFEGVMPEWSKDLHYRTMDDKARQAQQGAEQMDKTLYGQAVSAAKSGGASGINTMPEFELWRKSMPPIDNSSPERLRATTLRAARYAYDSANEARAKAGVAPIPLPKELQDVAPTGQQNVPQNSGSDLGASSAPEGTVWNGAVSRGGRWVKQ